MKLAIYTALLMILLALISPIIGLIVGEYKLFGCISIIFSWVGTICGIAAWIVLIKKWAQEEKEWEKEEHGADTSETVEYDSCKLTF